MKCVRFWAVTSLVLSGGVVLAGRPLNINDGEPLDMRLFQVETGVGFRHDSECAHFDFPTALTYGLLPNLEIGVGFGGQFEERTESTGETQRESGVGDMTLSGKWKLLSESGLVPAQALSPSVKFPTANDQQELGSGKADFDVTWIASKLVTPRACLHVNAGHTWVGDPDGEGVGNIFHCGCATGYRFRSTFQWVGEVFAQKELRDGAETAWQYNTGFRWDAVEGLTLDIAIGSKFQGDAPDFTATVGLTWVFGFAKQQNK